MLTSITILVFLTLILLFYIAINGLIAQNKPIGRLNRYINEQNIAPSDERAGKKGLIKILLYCGKSIATLKVFENYCKKIQIQLNKAHIPLKGEELIAICIISMISCTLIVSIALKSLPLGMVSGLLGWWIPMLFVKREKKKRIKILNDQLGDAIVLISNSLKAGYSFFQAVDTVSTEMSGSIAEEFGQVKKEINFGFTTEQALENLIDRVDSDDLELMVTAVLIQRQIGGNLAEILDNISDTIRDRVKIKGEVKAITAQGRMSGIIIAIIPPAMGLFLSVINPQHIALLFNNNIGLTMVGISVIMELMGIYFISKIVKIEI